MTEKLLEGLNPAQAQAVTAPQGPLLVIAGPGSGKTRVISHRVAWLAQQEKVPPESILAVTFTNKAAGEMAERIRALAPDNAAAPRTATFHSWCAALLRRKGGLLGLAPNYTIFGDEEREAAVKHCLERNGYDPGRYRPSEMAAAISDAKNRLESPEQALAAAAEEHRHVTARIYRAYEELLRRNNATDLDGLIARSVALLESFPRTLEEIKEHCRCLLVDEFQDTNAAQYRLARLLAGAPGNICAVGDPDQSIYSWRSAAPENVDAFLKDYPEARTITLERNYRSTANILNGAKELIRRNPENNNPNLTHDRETGTPISRKRYRNPSEEAEAIVLETLRLAKEEGIAPGRCAVLIRTNRQASPVIEACLRNGLECRTPATDKSRHRKALEELTAYLKAAANPRDGLSLERIINAPCRGIGPRTMEKLQEYCRRAETSLPETLEAIRQAHEAGDPCPAGLPPRCAAAAAGFSRDLSELVLAVNRRPASQAVAAAAATAGSKDPETAADLAEIAEAFDSMPPPEGIRELLQSAALKSGQDRFEPEENSLNLITLHQAKGLEFEAVFIPGMEEGLLPHYRSAGSKKGLEEERRLCFVGITRARRKLHLSWCARRRNAAGEWTSPKPSRFLGEIPPEKGAAERRPPPQGPQPGDPVWHPAFGQGKIVRAGGGRDAAQITVRFSRGGVRTLPVRLPRGRRPR